MCVSVGVWILILYRMSSSAFMFQVCALQAFHYYYYSAAGRHFFKGGRGCGMFVISIWLSLFFCLLSFFLSIVYWCCCCCYLFCLFVCLLLFCCCCFGGGHGLSVHLGFFSLFLYLSVMFSTCLCVKEGDKERQRDGESMFVNVFMAVFEMERERERMCMGIMMWFRESVCTCVCV